MTSRTPQSTARWRLTRRGNALMMALASGAGVCAGLGLSLVLQAAQLPPATSQAVDFRTQIRPLLENRCYECHGSKRSEAGLRLDIKAAALKGGDSGPVILPGESANSLLVKAVAWVSSDLKMPKKGERLSDAQIGLIRGWIDQGAAWPEEVSASEAPGKDHWAFKPPQRPTLLSVRGGGGSPHPIDAFVRARLDKEKLKPSPEADRTTLIRRLCLDLTGLPPTPAEVDAFVSDSKPGAYDRLVERLLESPHYGERWGRHWLDAARYADSDGFEKDKQRFVWFYRDWVVNAFNRDLPYNQFLLEQLAGDLLPGATQDQVVATGFLRNSMINEEGGVDPEQFRMEAMFDRMDAIGKGMLGLTIQCAQCHNHKYDPLTQEEYYRMFAFLNNDAEANVVVYTPEELQKRSAILREVQEIEAELMHRTPDWETRLARWEVSARAQEGNWTMVPVQNSGDNSQRYFEQPDGSLLVQGYAPTRFTGTFTNTVKATDIRAFRLETLTDDNLPAHGPGRSITGVFALSDFKVEAADAANPTNKIPVKWVGATADYGNKPTKLGPPFDESKEQKWETGPVEYAIDDKPETAWGIDAGPGRRNQDRKAVFVASTNIAFPSGTILTFHLRQGHGGPNSDDNQNLNLGRFRLSISPDPAAVADPVPRRLRNVLAIAPGQRSEQQKRALFSHWRTTVPEWKAENERIEALWRQHPEGATQLVLTPREGGRMTTVLRRGDWLKPGRPVEPGVPAFLNPMPDGAPANRLGFARWMVDTKAPTTARAMVNRVWQTYFGTGLVATSEDLGVQAEPPSHPELLDWLSVDFMENGWSLKKLHRRIVSSATYKQSSRVTPGPLAADPYNRLLARGARFRVEGEVVRDISLAASGLLNTRVGGRGVYPPAPSFLFQPPASYGPKVWNEEAGEDRYRRALYTFRYRSVPYPVLQNFDTPNGDFACVRRARSNTPLQALTSLNETLFMEAAKSLAAKTLESGGNTDAERLTYAFRRCLSRKPTRAETAELLGLLHRQEAYLREGWVNSMELATINGTQAGTLPGGATPTQLAAWTTVARVLLNLDETITRE